MIGNRSHTMTWGALVMVIPVLFYQKLWHRVTRWVPECRPNSHPLKLPKCLAHPTLCNRTPWYAHSWFVDGQCVDDATPAHATIWSVTWDHWSCSPTPGGSVRVERVFADGGRVTACNESPWWDRWCFVDEVCLSHVLTWQGEALISPLFLKVHVDVDGVQVSLWSRAHWSRNGYLVSCALPIGLASLLLSILPVLQERNLVYVVDIEISLAKLFNTALVAEDEEDLV